MSHPRIAICGSGTGVGKTHVARALVAELLRRGHAATALKPIESGFLAGHSDAEHLAQAARARLRHPLYALREPVSPHRAARLEGVTIDLNAIAEWVEGDCTTVIETAGGLLSPLSSSATNLDLIVRLDADAVVLVAIDRLGALHDVRACSLALAGVGLWPRTIVVLVAPLEPDRATGTNAGELRELAWAASVVCFPRASLGDPRSLAQACQLADRIEALG